MRQVERRLGKASGSWKKDADAPEPAPGQGRSSGGEGRGRGGARAGRPLVVVGPPAYTRAAVGSVTLRSACWLVGLAARRG